jgi:hypothetical protein
MIIIIKLKLQFPTTDFSLHIRSSSFEVSFHTLYYHESTCLPSSSPVFWPVAGLSPWESSKVLMLRQEMSHFYELEKLWTFWRNK